MNFYNRTVDTEQIANKIEESCNEESFQNVIVFLYGNQGIGKTAFIEHLIKTRLLKYQMVNIPNNSKNTSSGSYLRKIAYELNQFCEDNPYEAILDAKSFAITSTDILKDNIKEVASNLLGIGNIQTNIDLELKNLILLKKFIIQVLNNSHLILNIENMQNIDDESYDYLLDIIKNVKNTIFVFHNSINKYNYTDIDYMSSRASDLKQQGNSIILFELEMLDFKEAIKVLPKNIPANEIDTIHEKYIQSGGNLDKLIVYDVDHSSSNCLNLSDDILYILNIISLNDNEIEESQLKRILISENLHYKSFSIIQYTDLLDSLKKFRIIETNKSNLSIVPSFIDSLIKKTTFSIKYNAYSSLLSYYINLINKNNNTLTEDALYHIFSLSIEFADNQIIRFLPLLKIHSKYLKYPDLIINKLKKYLDVLSEKQQLSFEAKYKIYTVLIEIMIENNDFENAKKYLFEIKDWSNNNHIIMYSKILLLENSNQALTEIDNLVNSINDNRVKLIVSLSKLHLMLKLSNNNDAYNFARELYLNNSYSKFPEYGFVLCNYAELLISSDEAINIYNESINLFEKSNVKEYENFVLPSLAMTHGYKGNIKKAKKILTKIKHINRDVEVYYHNNISTLDILANNISFGTLEHLNNALLLSIYEYEHIIIHNNLLISYILLNDREKAKIEYDYILKVGISKYKNSEFLLMNYRNIIYYLNYIGNCSDDIIKYKNKIRDLINSDFSNDGVKEIASAILNNKILKEYYYTKLNYHPEFLCYWGIPLLLLEK